MTIVLDGFKLGIGVPQSLERATISHERSKQMPLRVKCPSCQSILQIPSKFAGESIACPKCDKRLKVPNVVKPIDSQPNEESSSTRMTNDRRTDTQSAKTVEEDLKSRPKPPPLPRGREQQVKSASKPFAPAEQTDEPAKTKMLEDASQAAADAPSRRDSAPPSSESMPPRRSRRRRRGKRTRDDNASKNSQATPTQPARDGADDKTAAVPPVPAPNAKANNRPTPKTNVRQSPPAAPKTQEPKVVMTPSRGFEHDPNKLWVVYQLGAAMIALALISVIPAVLDIIEHFRTEESVGVAPWAYALILVVTIQLGYACYVMQLPDWSTTWVVSLVTLFMATMYAMLLGIALLSKEQSDVIQWLRLADKLQGNKVVLWSFIMLSLSSLLTYFSGRISVRWYQAYQVLMKTGGLSAKQNYGA